MDFEVAVCCLGYMAVRLMVRAWVGLLEVRWIGVLCKVQVKFYEMYVLEVDEAYGRDKFG